MKVVPIWFTTFEEYGESYMLKRVDSHDSAAGLAFFAASIGANELPNKMEQCTIRILVTFATGEKRTVQADIKVKTDVDHLERRVPKSLSYIRHESVWTHCA